MSRFRYCRTIHFSDTDAGGVVFFARYLIIAHEAYEEALQSAGLPLFRLFVDQDVMIPVTRSEASYLRPLQCGDMIEVEVAPARQSENSFAMDYVMWKVGSLRKRAAVIRTEHVCIAPNSRKRQPLPAPLADWMDG